MSREKRIKCPAGVWTTIYSSSFTGVPSEWVVRFEPAAGAALSGKITEKRTMWIFPGSEVSRDLAPEMRITRNWINTFYSVKVRPDAEADAIISRAGLF